MVWAVATMLFLLQARGFDEQFRGTYDPSANGAQPLPGLSKGVQGRASQYQ